MMSCKGLCNRVRYKFKLTPERRINHYFSCNTCKLYFDIEEYDHLYHKHKELQNIILNNRGQNQLILFVYEHKRNACFCCSRKFTKRVRGSNVSKRRNLLEEMGIIRRI